MVGLLVGLRAWHLLRTYRGSFMGPEIALESDAGGLAAKCMAKTRTPAVAHLETSSAANIGADRDWERRQPDAIQVFAKLAGFEMGR